MMKINGKIIWQIMNPHKNSRELGENKNTPGIRVSRIGKDEKSEVTRQLAIDDFASQPPPQVDSSRHVYSNGRLVSLT